MRYCLVDQQGKPINVKVSAEKPIRNGNDLVITLQDGREVVLKGFFLAKKPVKSTASADDSASDDAPRWLQFEDGHLVAVIEGYIESHSDNTLATGTLPSTEDIQAALKDVHLYTLDSTTASLLPMDTSPPVYLADASEPAGLPYLDGRIADQQIAQQAAPVPTDSANPSALATPAGSFNALPYVGGILGVLVIAGAASGGGGGGGGGTGGGTGGGGEPVKPVENMLLASPVLGAVLPGNDLVVWVYKVKADGTAESQPFITQGTVGADGKAHLNMGSYTGLVKVVVRDAGSQEDFTDDATGQRVDATPDGVDLAVGYGVVLAGSNILNLNHVTTLIAAKVEAGNSITQAALATASMEIAAILHIPPGINLFSDTLTPPTASATTVDFYGLANAVLYAADKKSPGFIQSLGSSPQQQTIDDAFRGFVLTPVGSNQFIQAAVAETLGNGVVESPELSLVDAVVGGATHAEATAAAGVLRVSAQSGHIVSLTFTDSSGHSLIKPITATGALQSVTLDATDLGAGSQQLSDGSITVSATSSNAFGKHSTVRSLTFSLDGGAPDAPGIALGANASNPVSREEALGTGLLNFKAEANSILNVTLTDVSGHSVVRSLIGQGTDAAHSPVSLGLTAADLGTSSNQLAEGSITVTAVATDAAGNEGAASTFTFLLDYMAPVAPEVEVNPTFTDTNISLDEATATDGVIFVQAEAGSVISVEFQDGSDRPGNTVSRTVAGLGAAGVGVQLTAADLGTGTNQLQDGTVTVRVKARDAAGNDSVVSTFTLVLDTNPPGSPGIAFGTGVADGATAAEATAAGGVVAITAKQGSNVRVIFSDGTNDVVKNVIGQGEGTAVGVVLSAADLAVFGNNYSGDISVRAQATGVTGNRSPESSATFTLDRLAPVAPGLVLVSDTGTDGDGITSNAQIRISGLETAVGTRWYFRVDGGAEQQGTVAIANGSSTLTATPGSHQYQVWQVDKAGNAGPFSSINVHFQDGPPTALILSNRLSLLRGQTATLTITLNQDIGNTLELGDFTASNGTLSNLQVSANPLVYTAVFTPNANSSGSASVVLAAGAVTNLVGVSNVSGASINLPFDTTGPATPTLTLANDVIGGATLAEVTASTGIVMVQAESGTSVHLIFRDPLGREVVRDFTGNGNSGVWVTLGASDLGGGVNQLSKGAIQITATATNASGNPSDTQVTQFTFDPDPPANAVLALAPGLGSFIAGSKATAAGGLLSLVAEAGSTVQVTLRDQSGSSVLRTLTGNGSTPVWLTLASSEMGTGAGKLQDGAITVSAVVTDAAGNQAASNALGFELDNIAPTTPTLTLVDTLVSRSEVLGTLLTIGSQSGTQVRVEFTDRLNHTVVRDYTTGVNGSRTISLLSTELGTDSSQLADGEVTVRVTATDTAGNTSSNSRSFTLDTTPPANPVLDMGPGVTGDVSRDEALAANGVLSLQAELNSTLSVTLSDTSGHSVVRPLIGRGATAVPLVLTAADLGGATGLTEGTITVLATATDAAGNPAASSASRTFFLDTVKPDQPQLALAPEVLAGATRADATATGAGTASGGVISVRAETGSAVRVTFSDGTRSVVRSLTGNNTAQWVTLADSEIGTGAGKLQDGTITVTAVVSDAAGNASEASTSFTLDTAAPTAPGIGMGSGLVLGQVVSRSKALQAAGVLAVSAESGASVALTLTDAAEHQVSRRIVVGASAAALTLAAGELGTDSGQLGNGTITVRAKATDAAGNEGPELVFTFGLDATAPSAPAIALGNGITGEVVSGSKATQAAGVLALTAESGSQVVLTLTDRLGHQIPRTLTAGATSSAITLTAAELGTDVGQLSDGSITVSAVATDAAGNSSLVGSFSFTLDTAASTPTITLGNGVTGVVSQAEALRAGGVIRVAADAGDQIRLTFTDTAMQSHSVIRTINNAAGAANPLGITLGAADLGGASGLADGTIHVRAEAIDAVGNTSSTGTFRFDLDTTFPGVPSISLGAGVSGAVSRTEALAAGVLQVEVVAADIGSLVELTLTDKLGNQIGRNFTATGTSSAITLAATDLGTVTGTLSDGNISVTARATDPAGNSSALGSFSFNLDTAVLPPGISLGSGVTGDVSLPEATLPTGV
ncbi:MAG: Ig-like domain-containing protein, partial [Rhodoferax sp.]|nr:Ig-like domain-containing protein [Rhodoferax sp.]